MRNLFIFSIVLLSVAAQAADFKKRWVNCSYYYTQGWKLPNGMAGVTMPAHMEPALQVVFYLDDSKDFTRVIGKYRLDYAASSKTVSLTEVDPGNKYLSTSPSVSKFKLQSKNFVDRYAHQTEVIELSRGIIGSDSADNAVDNAIGIHCGLQWTKLTWP